MQQFLTNLLPGLRELRAPLAAGYIWMAFVWVLVVDRVPSVADAQDAFAAVDDLAGAIALGFVAYLLGAVSEAVSNQSIRFFASSSTGLKTRPSKYQVPLSRGTLSRAGRLVLDRLQAADREIRGAADMSDFVSERYPIEAKAAAAEAVRHLERVIRFMLEGDAGEDVSLIEIFKERRSAWSRIIRSIIQIVGQSPRDRQVRRRMKRPFSSEDHFEFAHVTSRRVNRLFGFGNVWDAAWILEGSDINLERRLDRWIRRDFRWSRWTAPFGTWPANVAHLLLLRGTAHADISAHTDSLKGALTRSEKVSKAGPSLKQVEDLERSVEKELPAGFAGIVPSIRTRLFQDFAQSVLAKLLQELHLVERRLIAKNAELYGQFDRLKAESDFRLAISPPLLALTVALAVESSPWFLFGVVFVGLLTFSGWLRGREAGDALIDAMLAADVEPPVLQELREAVERQVKASTPVRPTAASTTPPPASKQVPMDD